MNANNSKSDGKQHQRFSKVKEGSNEYQQEYKAKTVNDLLDELDHVVPKDPGTKGDQLEAQPVSLLEMPPVEWPDSFSILGSALDDLSYFNSISKPPEKKSLLGRPESRIFSNSNIDVNDPHFQSLVQKQIEMASKLKTNDDKPSSSTTNAASNHKPSSSKKNSRWSYDDPFSTSENLNDDDKTIFFDNPPSCLLYKGMDSSQQPSYPQWQGYDVTTTPEMPYGYIDPYETHPYRRKKYQKSRGQNKRSYDYDTRHDGFNSSKSYTKGFCKSAPNLPGRGGTYGKRGGGSVGGGRRENHSSKYSSNVDNYGSNEETSSHFDNGLPREFGKKEPSIPKYVKKRDPSFSKHSHQIGRNKFYSSHDFRPSFSRSPPRSRLSSRRSPHRDSHSRSRSPIYAKSDRHLI
uniref:Uncharacterized protein n=1 Tax=Panagrolaimus sp. PS1159 TaxID=55785 RepID=A0AC35GNJ8_9BILA